MARKSTSRVTIHSFSDEKYQVLGGYQKNDKFLKLWN